MTKTTWIPDRMGLLRSVALAAGGALALGALLGLPFGPQALVRMAITLPAVLFGVSAICAPALCIGGCLLDGGFPLGSAAVAFASALRATGHVLIGFVPVALFLATTGVDQAGRILPVAALIAIAVFLGLVRLWAALGVARGAWPRLLPLFAGWSAVSLGIGLILMARTMVRL
jgi:hypothetical protein